MPEDSNRLKTFSRSARCFQALGLGICVVLVVLTLEHCNAVVSVGELYLLSTFAATLCLCFLLPERKEAESYSNNLSLAISLPSLLPSATRWSMVKRDSGRC